jgi:DNA repair ATPase RecN
MKLTILKIILWPKNTTLPPRVIEFVPQKINVLTGESGTGKSTLTWIVDYCLGSGKCSIPVGLIRDVTGWFGVHMKLANTELLVARRNPEDQQTTIDLYWEEGLDLQVPPVVAKNARVEDLKNRLNQIAHLPNLDFSTDERTGYGGRPSCRDMAAFNFQPQHIVANPYTFFFKADTTEHREKLRIIFPLVLGAIDSESLAKQRELKDKEREHDKLRRELEARLNAARAWEAEIESYYLQARALGLLPNSEPSAPDWPLDRYLLALRTVPESVRQSDLPDVQTGTSEAAVSDLTALIAEEDKLSEELGSIRRRLSKLDQLSASVDDYGVSLTAQEDRLQGTGWFAAKIGDSRECPVCLSTHEEPSSRLADLRSLADQLKTLSASVQTAPAKLDQEAATLRQDLREREEAISKARQKRKFLENQSNAESARRQRVRQIYLFVGRVEQALENVSTSRNVDDLARRVKLLADEIAGLRRDLDPNTQRNRLNAALDSVSARIADYARLLNLEHSSENVRLNAKELTLQFSPLSGRTDFLWEVGSGQNWVGYHIAGLLALHEHFVTLTRNPVPRFLMIDQPSQVYFPEAWPDLNTLDSDTARSADIAGVHRIFEALGHFMSKVPEFQIIVTEHAGAITWEGVANVHVVGNWREGQGDFLVPNEWIPQQ